jgi:cbb3-type cytochrome oxidase subunit 3
MRLSDIMSHAGLAGWAQVALVIFLAAFVVILVALFAPSRRSEFDRASRMPLNDDVPVTPRERSGEKP